MPESPLNNKADLDRQNKDGVSKEKSINNELLPLPSDILNFILFDYCGTDAAILASASTQFSVLPRFHQANQNKVNRLLRLTAHPQEENLKIVKSMIELDYSLIMKKGSCVEKHCGRRWSNISALQFAAWAGDNFIVNIFLDCLPKELLHEAALQLEEIFRKTTNLNGGYLAPYRELITAYKHYKTQYYILNCSFLNRNSSSSQDKINELWIQGIGGAQRLLPIYGLQEFCSHQLFEPLPSFKIAPRRVLLDNDRFFPLPLPNLGIRFALYRTQTPGFTPGAEIAGPYDTTARPFGHTPPDRDSNAIIHFCKVKEEELRHIIKRLHINNAFDQTSERENEDKITQCMIM